MADAILMAGGTGGVSSDDVTAGKAQVLQGYKTVTTDSNDEVVEGTIVTRDHAMPAAGFENDASESRYLVRLEEGFYSKRGSWKPCVTIPYAVLAGGIGVDAGKMLDTLTISGVRGTIPVRGYHGPDSSEMWLYPQEGGYVVRVEEGYYHMGGNRQWKPYVIAPTALVKSAVNYHPEYTLNNTTTCGEQGQVKMINTQDNGYAINQAKLFGMDSGRGKLVMQLGHGNAYYYRNDNSPHVEVDASVLGTAGADSVLQWQTASSQYGIKFEGTIPRWIATHGDVILANPSHSGQGFAYDLPNVGRCIVVGIKNGAFIQGANYVALPSPNFQSWNIRKNVNINGTIGTMEDYGAGRVAFRNATFDGVLISGVANKGFILNGINKYLNTKNGLAKYDGIKDGGIKLINTYAGNTRHTSAPDTGCVIANSINLTPFKQIKVGFLFWGFKGDGTASQPARISFICGVARADGAGAEKQDGLSYTILKELGRSAREESHVMTSTTANGGNLSDQSQKFLILNTDDLDGHHFLYFILGDAVHEYTKGFVHGAMVVNSIEFIN